MVYKAAAPKSINGTPMTGPLLVRLLQAAIAAVNSDKDGLIRSLGSVWKSLVAAELERAKAAAVSCYSAAAVGLDICSSVQAAEDLHKVCKRSAAVQACFTHTAFLVQSLYAARCRGSHLIVGVARHDDGNVFLQCLTLYLTLNAPSNKEWQ
jgi:hypothetical protein